MAVELFANAAESTLAAPILAATTALPVVSAATFPPAVTSPALTRQFRAALADDAGTILEYITVTAISGNTLTVVRASESAARFPAASRGVGVRVVHVLTAEAMQKPRSPAVIVNAKDYHSSAANTNIPSTGGRAVWYRCPQGYGRITKMGVYIAVTSADTISLAVARGTETDGPTNVGASTGSVPTPAVGYAEIALTAPWDFDYATDYVGASASGITTKAQYVGSTYSSSPVWPTYGGGANYFQHYNHPLNVGLPITVDATGRAPIIVLFGVT